MSDQGDLFDGERRATEEELGLKNVRRTDPDTSQAAAREDRSILIERIYVVVRVCSLDRGLRGATSWEVHRRSGIKHESCHKRLSDLRREGRVYDSGLRRKGDSGRDCIVWRSTR